MKYRMLATALAASFASAFMMATTPAQATQNINPCGVQGWYVNPDETDNAPTRSEAGFFFDGKDLIHHATSPIDLPDIKANTLSFVADTPGKVVGKMETENPYSTIVQQADGKFWSTAMTYDQIGGQGHPVNNVSDLVGTDEDPRPTKPGKAQYNMTSHVVTFGVGYWVEDGNTTVSSIKFHGVNYDLSCKTHTTPPTTAPTHTTSPTASSSASQSTSASPSHTVTASSTPTLIGAGTGSDTNLPVTGASTGILVAVSIVLLGVGTTAFFVTRRRNKFVA